MMSFFVGFAFFELGVFCGFFAASLMQAARTGEIVITVKEDTDGTGKEYPFGAACSGRKCADGNGKSKAHGGARTMRRYSCRGGGINAGGS